MSTLWTAFRTWLNAKLATIEIIIVILAAVLMFVAGYKFAMLIVDAGKSDQKEQIAASVPQIITKTQTILKVIHDSKDACTNAPIDPAILKQLRQQ